MEKFVNHFAEAHHWGVEAYVHHVNVWDDDPNEEISFKVVGVNPPDGEEACNAFVSFAEYHGFDGCAFYNEKEYYVSVVFVQYY